MFLNKITEKLQIHACYHKTYLRMYRCQLKSFFIKTIKIWKDFFSSLHIIKTNELVRRIEVKVLNVESVATKKVTVPMALGHECKKSHRELILKWKCENAGMWQETLLQNTYVFERIFFFFARQCNPLIKQIIFQKHWFNGTADHNNLHILYQKAQHTWNDKPYKTFDSIPHNFLQHNWTDCFRQHINFYYHRVCKKNLIRNWK